MKVKITVDVSECMPLLRQMFEATLSDQIEQRLQPIQLNISCVEDKVDNITSDRSFDMQFYEDLD